MKQGIVTDKSLLHVPSREIELGSPTDMAYAKRVIADLRDTLAASKNGVGIAASQIGEKVRIFLMMKSKSNIVAVINPSFTSKNGKITLSTEGCLSCPNATVTKIPRYKTIYAEGFDENGEPIKFTLTGLPAIIFQHELDHCDGVIITDKK